MDKDVIVACDFPSAEETYKFLDLFTDTKPYVKIGMELYYAEGPKVVSEIKARGHKIFLDLKLHDIPNTVAHAASQLAKLGVDMTNVHCAGGAKMMAAAKATLEGSSTKLIAVTQLTSTSEEVMHEELLLDNSKTIKEVVINYAQNAKDAGLDGVVCSPLEAGEIKKSIGDEFLTITPGIRFADDAKGDQVRVTTPADAKASSDFIVVGRSITAASDPVAAYNRCVQDFLGE
ncbi:MAG: orotidine-5'-phosphate decarboxylase [Coriobacteriia bacterium]|nr:orotidine-5'-phosphate decarboxylase [Coriobacteriia bacterium]